MSLSTTVLVTSLTWIVLIIIGLGTYILLKIHFNRQHFIDLCIRTKTGGKPQVDLMKAKLYRSKRYGNWIYVPKRKIVIPRFDQEAFLPRRASGRMYLDVTTSDSYYYANKWTPLNELRRGDIYLTDDEGIEHKFATKEQVGAFLRSKYKLLDYNDFGGMVNQIPHVDRAQALIIDEVLANLNKEKTSFWKSPQFIFIATLIIAAIVFIVMMVLGIQHSEAIAGVAKQAGNGALDTLANKMAAPPTP